ncbi:D-glycero-beta-D-manno-heptose 1-phosphate adenylyltransferase [Nocardia sp. CDC159]|uniref:Bifunctional protein HldE n=1 Tax=Nocardia pulmonis TaxID=2951408 RepID=A0A9X2E0W8_9NOCA|nr:MULTISPECIES: D-glycero-beta-D-manno-heptose 1-phosphate adenylyltransferase [Nocardia]MCM6772137.1 D-glycero-beta-D-manno-heptose 1-phosphate adenylyltransferase [Nocardia pulmonis]MCM6785205.1 D-glycero-beta-D-manno-heptose 1-phosphate adenylyltransferase [Nocardia sp. CDC159]
MRTPISDTPDHPDFDGHELTPALAERLARTRARVVVLGDAVLDVWMWGRSQRLCREAPVPVVDIDRSVGVPGGAANTAANLAALGAQVRLVTLLGDDAAAEQLCERLREHGVDDDHVLAAPNRSTVIKRRVLAGDQLMIRFDEGEQPPPDPLTHCLLDALADALIDADALIVCDYDGGLATALRKHLTAHRSRLPLLVVDSHRPADWRPVRPDITTPNAAEAAAALGLALPSNGDERVALFDRERARLFEATGADTVAVTLDRDGALLLSGDRPAHRTWARPVAERQSTGGGDTFVAAFTLALLAGLPETAAAELAQAAADVVVHRPGTSVCSNADLRERLLGRGGDVLTHDELAAALAAHRRAGRRIVFTNGCFDVLHTGHIAYLNGAKRLGDVLVVAVNSDRGVRELKGPDRPVNSEHDRAAVLAALSCVDHVTIFDEPTPAELLRRVRPELYVKGGDYRPEMLSETEVVHAYGGEVQVLGYVAQRSTTALIERIRAGAAS